MASKSDKLKKLEKVRAQQHELALAEEKLLESLSRPTGNRKLSPNNKRWMYLVSQFKHQREFTTAHLNDVWRSRGKGDISQTVTYAVREGWLCSPARGFICRDDPFEELLKTHGKKLSVEHFTYKERSEDYAPSEIDRLHGQARQRPVVRRQPDDLDQAHQGGDEPRRAG
jgi:hypothetical protein